MEDEQPALTKKSLAKFWSYFQDESKAIFLDHIRDPSNFPPVIQQILRENHPDFPPFEFWEDQYKWHKYNTESEFVDSILEYFACVPNLFTPETLNQIPMDDRALVSIFEMFHLELTKLRDLLLLDERTLYARRIKYYAQNFNKTYQSGFRFQEAEDQDLFPSLSPFGIFPSHDLPDMVNPSEV